MDMLFADSNACSRREFLRFVPAVFLTQMVKVKEVGPRGTLGIAYDSFNIRKRQASQTAESGSIVGIAAEKFIDLCKSFGADGCQMDYSQLVSHEASYLKRIRQAAEDKGMFLVLSVSPELAEDRDGFAEVAAAAQELGISRLRLGPPKRRHEDFSDVGEWREYSDSWYKKLMAIEPVLREHKLHLGVENHKDWLADEMVELLQKIGSSHIGVCLDFGNNLTLLEDPLEVAQKLAPFAVTSHLKDLAISATEDGFLVADVPLGQGVLPLAKIMETLRRAHPDISFCLEMITRDPVKVLYLEDKYWAARGKRDEGRISKFQSQILSQATTKPLSRVSGMSSARMLAVEDDNIRRSVAYARRTLGL